MTEFASQPYVTLRCRHWYGSDDSDVARPCAGCGEQCVSDVENHLALDEQLIVEDKRVLREIHHAFDRVLDGHDTVLRLATLHGIKNVGNGSKRDVLFAGKVRLAEQRLFRKCA